MSDFLKWFLELYVHVFKNYPLAASLTTAMFVAAYFLWKHANTPEGMIGLLPPQLQKKPELVLMIGWLIVTPMLGFVFTLCELIKDALAPVLELYFQIFKSNPAAGAIVTVVFIAIWFLWATILRRWAPTATGWWSHPGLVLLIVWLLATPILGLVIKAPTSQKEQQSQQAKPQPPTIGADKSGAQNHK